jgi:transposase-like protein
MNTENKSTEVDNTDKKLHISDVISSYLCDSCGETFTSEKHKIYDENFNECYGLIECSKCFTSRV